jgi:preprotein translocase subunit Sss1
MALDPRRASVIDIARIATGTCVGLIGYLVYVLISILATA